MVVLGSHFIGILVTAGNPSFPKLLDSCVGGKLRYSQDRHRSPTVYICGGRTKHVLGTTSGPWTPTNESSKSYDANIRLRRQYTRQRRHVLYHRIFDYWSNIRPHLVLTIIVGILRRFTSFTGAFQETSR